MRRAFVFVVLLSCGSHKQFSQDDWSLCGAVVLQNDWFTGHQLRQAQFSVLLAAQKFTTLDPKQICAALAGFKISVQDNPCWIDPYGRSVCGLSWCGHNVIQIGTPTWKDWRATSIAHQMFHVAQGCQVIGEIDEGMDRYHANWKRSGINDALQHLDTQP